MNIVLKNSEIIIYECLQNNEIVNKILKTTLGIEEWKKGTQFSNTVYE